MTEITVYNLEKKKVASLPLPEGWDQVKRREGLVHQVVVQQMTNKRAGTAKVKSRHEVKGSTRKIYRQKGTGRARHGDIKAPLFVGGGQAFGPKPHDWCRVIPKKMRQQALLSLLLERLKADKILIVDRLEIADLKTKKAAEAFKKLGVEDALVVLNKDSKDVGRAIRNLKSFTVADAASVSVLDVLSRRSLIFTKASFEELKGRVS